MTGAAPRLIEVVAGVIFDSSQRILISRRPYHLHQGGLWEFPGGKLEPDETPRVALERELREELDIEVEAATPLITLTHDYPDRRVRLHVWRIERFSGVPSGLEGQPWRWVTRDELNDYTFPAANLPIIAAARLPDRYAILDEPHSEGCTLLGRIRRYAERGIELIRLRASGGNASEYIGLAREAVKLAEARGMALMIHGSPAWVQDTGAAGLHLRTHELMRLEKRPIGRSRWLAASCHDAEQLRQAARIGVDFVVLGPVASTATHPGAKPLGWNAFAELVEAISIPVFALGGLSDDDIARAKHHGAQGIAGIRCFLS
ncbi:MAG: Nudix family hydrolase [Methylococcus sp.]